KPPEGKQSGLQNLHYTYDPAGNITHIRDDAQQTIYFDGQVVPPHCDYTYDAIYRLISAVGREHIGQVGQPQTTWNDEFRVRLQHPGDGQAMRNYTEAYEYDAVGNFQKLIHQAADGSWTRSYAYNEASLIEPAKKSNRLSSTTVRNGAPETYSYDAHGNMTSMPHLSLVQWDYQDQLQATSKQVVNNGGTPETTWYVYDAGGQRVRKVTEHQAAAGQTPTRMKERIYLGGFEIYREHENDGDTVNLERETLHIMDDQQRIALVEARTINTPGNDPSPPQLIRYQLSNHLGSASLELNDQAQIISYEEYYPYGSTSYQAGRNVSEVSLKRYRYTGMERDEESGLEYHSARYYMPWLGRWVSPDPSGLVDGPNLFLYVNAKPIIASDPSGREENQLWLMEQKGTQINPIATRVSRGITSLQRAALRVLDVWFGPGKGAHWAHPPSKPFVIQRANTKVPLTASPGSDNMSKQNDSKVVGKQAGASGGFKRKWDGNHSVDQTVPSGTKIKQPPPEPHVQALAPFAKNLPKSTPTVAPPAKPPSVVKPPSTQLELDFERGAPDSAGVKGAAPIKGAAGLAKGFGTLSVARMPVDAIRAANAIRYENVRFEQLGYEDDIGKYTLWVRNNGLFYKDDYYKRYSTGTLAEMGILLEISKSEYNQLVEEGERRVGRFNFWGEFEYGTEGRHVVPDA
ncbi:MAG: RHS repeat-associated core domain-containing protein, partial [Rubrobacteraceae bacterium]